MAQLREVQPQVRVRPAHPERPKCLENKEKISKMLQFESPLHGTEAIISAVSRSEDESQQLQPNGRMINSVKEFSAKVTSVNFKSAPPDLYYRGIIFQYHGVFLHSLRCVLVLLFHLQTSANNMRPRCERRQRGE